MASEPQNKVEKSDGNVVALRRAEFVASIEKKLSEARRFFSVHDYASCAELVEEVLAADPQNSKAKALLDLSSIKISKRKLYKRIAEPPPSTSPASNPDSGTNGSTMPAASLPQDLPTASRTSSSELEARPVTSKTSSVVTETPLPGRRRRLPEPNAGPEDSMREKTITALVDLLKNKDTKFEDWKSNRSSGSSSAAHLPSAQSEIARPTTVEKPNPLTPRVERSKPLRQAGPPLHQPAPPAVLEANQDFLPGSLDDLFEALPAKSSPPSWPAPPVDPAAAKPPKEAVSPKTVTSPSEMAEPKQRRPTVPNVPPREQQINAEPPVAIRPPASMKEERKAPQEIFPEAPVTPLPSPSPPSSIALQAVQPPDIRIFHQIAEPRPLEYQEEVGRKIEQRSEELNNSEIQAGAIAQIKKFLYQEEYDLCARDLARIRDLFPQSPEIQAFVDNTSKRLVELQRLKKFEVQAKDLMASAVAFYQEGKREEALIAVREILRVNPNHVQAREFVSFVERHQGRDKKQPVIQKVRACRSCGSEVDAVSQFCYHCGKRL